MTRKVHRVIYALTALALVAGHASASHIAAAGEDERAPWQTKLQRGAWTDVHMQQNGDAVRFVRQAHGGAAFDSRHGRIVLFGSDTHGQDWSNSPLYFDTRTLAWSRAHSHEPPATYGITADGTAVAGEQADHPWAMHTFGAVTYDARRDEFEPIFGAHNGIRLPSFVQLDLRVERVIPMGSHLRAAVYLDMQNVTFRENAEDFVYSYDYRQRGVLRGLPGLAILGGRVEF